jgi:hypothetical protein
VLPVGRLLRVVLRLQVRASKRDVGRLAYVPFFIPFAKGRRTRTVLPD